MLFDSHSHLHFYQFDDDREDIIKKLRAFNIKTVNVGTNFEESKKAVELAKKYPDLLWASVGLHPNDVFKEHFDIFKYRELAKEDRAVAIGECGLDYFRIVNNELGVKNKQKDIFKKQIEFANALHKPLILHCRSSVGTQDAYEDAVEILKNKKLNIPSGNGVAHFFSGSKKTAKKFLDLGFSISFAGPITFVSEYREVVEFVPLDKILVETDSPFAAPLLHRGKRNEPAYVEFVARQVAEWKNLAFEEVVRQTAENVQKLFDILI